MFFDSIRRSASFAGVVAAAAILAPVGPTSAATSSTATPVFTFTPVVSLGTGSAISKGAASQASNTGVIELAQNRNARRRQVRRNRQRARNRRIYRNGRWWYYRNGGYYDANGVALAAGLVGLAAGAIAGAAIADAQRPRVVYEEYAQPAPYTAEWYRRCDIKYNSFRASDGTYLGYDGIRHTCRLP